MSAPSRDGRGVPPGAVGSASTSSGGSMPSSHRTSRSSRASSRGRYPDSEGMELAPIQEESLPGYGPYESSFLAISQATPATPPSSSDALLIREDASGYPWFRPSRSDSHSSGSLHGFHLEGPDQAPWPVGVKSGLFLVAFILLLNAIVTLWASLTFPVDGGLGTLYRGACWQVEKTGFSLHVLINIIGTLLLGASNYCMQCLTSPTRKEVDARHRVKDWLEVGILSVRNLRAIDRRRIWLWFFLGLSSFPIHLVFNSAIFVTLTANRYTVAAVSEGFIMAANWSLPGADRKHQDILTTLQKDAHQYERLEPQDCIRAYGVDFISDRRHVVVVTNVQDPPNALLGTLDWSYNVIQNSWVCGTNATDDLLLHPVSIDDFDCSVQWALATPPMTIAGHTVRYCLSQKVPDICRLQFSLPIMLVVILCNIAKLVCILLTLMKTDATLITMGDAIASFLTRPDPLTQDMGSLTMQDIAGDWPSQPQPRSWVYKRYFRWQSVGVWRWVATNVVGLTACAILGTILYLATFVTTTNPDIYTWWNLGFGTVTRAGLVRWPTPELGVTGLIRNVLLANTPQLAISTLYLVYDQVYTCMAFADEYARYFRRRQPLRVTRPRGAQRTTHFLTLPYRYILPIMVVSATAHFLLSQGFFLVAVDVFNLDGDIDLEQTIMTVGFSISALILLVTIVGLVVVTGLGMGLRRYPPGIPLAGPNSAAISAACHVAEGEDGEETAMREIQWGVVDTRNGIGKLAFSSGIVGEPVPGRLYR